MIQDEIQRGMQATWATTGLPEELLVTVADAVIANAVTDLDDHHAMTLSPDSDRLVYFDLFKAVTAIASIVASGVTLVAGMAPVSVLTAVAALGSLQGVRRPLSSAAGDLASILIDSPEHRLSRTELKSRFLTDYGALGAEEDFDRGLQDLQSVKAIKQEKGVVVMVERILLRI